MTLDLFDKPAVWQQSLTPGLAPGAVVLRGLAAGNDDALLAALHSVAAKAPFRHMTTPGGFRMSVAMTNCGSLGWVTDKSGYRYSAIDPETGAQWPPMPEVFLQLAQAAAVQSGYKNFVPDSCLINRYEPGTKLSLHQDKNERDFQQPIVSVSLGLPAVFQFAGQSRADKPERVPLTHGDVVVWGGVARLNYHGVLTLKPGQHFKTGSCRFNLTFRKAA